MPNKFHPIKSNQKKLSESLKDYLKENKQLGRSYQKFNIEDIWLEVVGQMVSNYTNSVKIVGTTLKVSISSSPLKQEINFSKKQLIESINQKLPYEKISEIVVY